MKTKLVQSAKSTKESTGNFIDMEGFGYGTNNTISDKHVYNKGGGGCCCCCCCCCCSSGAADLEE